MAEPSSAPLRRTPLHATHVASGARMTGFGGWDMPLSYAGQLAEHRATREAIGLFDVSHMGQVRFRGARSLEFLQLLVPADIAALVDRGSKYTQLCNHRGGVIDDLIVSRVSAEEFFAVVNASTKDGDVAWMRAQAHGLGFADVAIEDESDRWAMIAVQGPKALAALDSLVPGGKWSATPALTLHPFEFAGEPHLLSRTGYTGEAGAELLVPAARAVEWWERLVAAGGVPCGLAARDSLRLEAGYTLYGSDLDTATTPIEAGLGWSVSTKKQAPYIGREVIEREKLDGAQRRLVGLLAEGRRPLRHGDGVTLDGVPVGTVASGGYSPGLERGIALAYVETRAAAATAGLAVVSRGTAIPATITKPPFVKTSLKP